MKRWAACGNRASSSTRGSSMSEALRFAPRLSRSTARKTCAAKTPTFAQAQALLSGTTEGRERLEMLMNDGVLAPEN